MCTLPRVVLPDRALCLPTFCHLLQADFLRFFCLQKPKIQKNLKKHIRHEWAVKKISIVKTSNDVVEDLVIKENPAIISSPSDPKDMPAEPADPPTESPESKNLDEEGQITLNF